jgi:hypothetical protein
MKEHSSGKRRLLKAGKRNELHLISCESRQDEVPDGVSITANKKSSRVTSWNWRQALRGGEVIQLVSSTTITTTALK